MCFANGLPFSVDTGRIVLFVENFRLAKYIGKELLKGVCPTTRNLREIGNILSVCVSVSETLNGERDTFAKNVATFRRSDPLEESIDDRRDRPMIDRRWIEDLTLGLIRN